MFRVLGFKVMSTVLWVKLGSRGSSRVPYDKGFRVLREKRTTPEAVKKF